MNLRRLKRGGTALVDSVVRDVLYACRSFRRAPLAALTVVTTVALGLGLVAVVFTLLNAVIFRVDEVRNPHELFAVERQRSASADPERFTRSQYESLVRETNVFSDAYAIADIDSRIDAAFAEASAFANATADKRGKSAVGYKLVSPEFFSVLGIDIVRGRGFAETERTPSAAVVVVSESAARQLWPGLNPVGQVVRLEPDPTSDTQRLDEPPLLSRTFVVAGIARDVPGFQFTRLKQAVVYVSIAPDAARTSLALRVHGDPESARVALIERLEAIDPNMAEVLTLRMIAHMAAYFLQLAFWLTLVLGALALLLTLSGLFSVLSYLVEQRTREIAVRMALGATRRSIGALVLSQSARPVGIGLLVGGSLTAALGAALLTTPAAALIGSVVHLFDPVAYAASLLCIVTACVCAALIPALRAGRIDPIAALRQD
jgi:hypothetical protein